MGKWLFLGRPHHPSKLTAATPSAHNQTVLRR
jgi:hypothetical protein